VNLAGIIDPHPSESPALIDEAGAVTTYGELRRAVAAMRARLRQLDVGPDDRVAIVSANHPGFVITYLAILRAGAVAVPLNPGSPAPELDRELAQVDVKALIIGPGGDAHLDVRATTVPVLMMEDGAEAGASEEPAVPRDPGDLAALLFTAGTAGAPRAAMLTHGSLLANLEQVRRHPGQAIAPSDVLLGVLPLSHILGLNGVLGGALLAGASVVLVPRFDPKAVLDRMARHNVTIAVGAPSMFGALTATDEGSPSGDGRLRKVRLAIAGAAPLTADVADRWEQAFGGSLRQGYGLTEASPVVTMPRLEDGSGPTSIGVPVPGVEIRLVDEEGDEALAGDPGEIWVRGPNVFRGYWSDERATRSALTADGWLKTGDIAVIGDDGDLHIVDRAKDLIIVSGFNVYPVEVEAVLAEHPAVKEVAVVGAPSAATGEAVEAFVVVEPGQEVTKEQLAAWSTERLARYKCPTVIEFVPELPHGLAGKLLRRRLRADRTGA
jgi:long-chain acyl-CoA synthetase